MLKARRIERAALDPGQRAGMWRLFAAHYDAVDESAFYRDLGEKDGVFVLEDADGRCQGFSTFLTLTGDGPVGPARFLYSGDTIIAPQHWGRNDFALSWIRHAGRIAAADTSPLYWFLVVKGHRTYRYLSAFALSYWPRAEATPGSIKATMDRLARGRFGSDYDAAAGVVRFARSRGHLAAELSAPNPTEAARADVQFFLRANPGYIRGEELVCLCALAAENLKPLARRAFEAGMEDWRTYGC